MYKGNKARAALENESKNTEATSITSDSIKTPKLCDGLKKNGIVNLDFQSDECIKSWYDNILIYDDISLTKIDF